MKKITRLLSRLHPSRRHSSQLHVSPAPDSAASSPANRITKAGSANKLYISKFEQLPFDIRHQVLLAVDNIEDLGTLVRASPTYHQQYLHGRAFWLRRYLLLNIGHVLIDAYSANLCSSPSLRQRRNRQQVREFLAAYPSRRSTATVETLFASTSTEEIASIASFYTSTIRPLLQEYVAWTRSNLGSLSVPDQLSKAEQTRILRGMYRFQIFCNVFGYSRVDRDLTLSNDETLGLFLNIFEPWEFEEIICINSFADSRFQTVFDEVELDLHPDNPRFDAERRDLSTPDGAFDLSLNDDWFRNGMVSLGLASLCSTFKVRDHTKLVEMMSKSMVHYAGFWMPNSVYYYMSDRQHSNEDSDRDRAQQRRDKMPFIGDGDDSPPLAWVTIWRETYSNLYGYDIPDSLHSWGYIMWDARRLIDSGGIDILEQEWKAMYLDENDEIEDPRDLV